MILVQLYNGKYAESVPMCKNWGLLEILLIKFKNFWEFSSFRSILLFQYILYITIIINVRYDLLLWNNALYIRKKKKEIKIEIFNWIVRITRRKKRIFSGENYYL